jgi:hypothetical protein
MRDSTIQFRLSPKKVGYGFGCLSAGLVVIHVVMQMLKYIGGHDVQLGLLPYFNLDAEGNLPSWYAASTLLFCAGLLAIIAQAKQRQQDRYARQWLGLCLIFAFLSLDEATSLHEHLSDPTQALLPSYTTGYFYYAWVIPVACLLPLLGVTYARFLLALPRRFAWRFIVAGIVYVGGAVGVELLGGRSASLQGTETLTYALLVALEEGCEMIGIVIFLSALTAYAVLQPRHEQAPSRRPARTASLVDAAAVVRAAEGVPQKVG